MRNEKIRYIVTAVLILLLLSIAGCKFYLPKTYSEKTTLLPSDAGNMPQINNENQSPETNKENDSSQGKATVTTDAAGNVVYEYEIDENIDYNSTEPVKDGTDNDRFTVESVKDGTNNDNFAVEPVKDGTDNDNFTVEPDVEIKYFFRNEGLLTEHFEKHGQEFPYETKEDYLLGANIMLQNPDKLHKKEKEDNDDVYYLEATNEFIIVSGDGYIRTYFKPTRGKKYYDSQ